jgi:hypothetical protein
VCKGAAAVDDTSAIFEDLKRNVVMLVEANIRLQHRRFPATTLREFHRRRSAMAGGQLRMSGMLSAVRFARA